MMKWDSIIPLPVATPSIPPISPLRGLLEVTKLMRAEGDLPELLSAIARTISESLGYRTVVVNLYRPAWDTFSVTTVHGNDAARSILLGQVRTWDEWTPLLQPEFERRGAFVVPAGAYDWDTMLGDRSYVPDSSPGRGENGWQPEDALFLPMRHSDGHLLGILSVDEPVSGRRPTDEELDVLVALAEHAALAVQSAQEGKQAARHRLALERLLGVSSRLIAEPATDDILRAVCSGVREALGFQNVLAALRDPDSGRLDPRAAVGWDIEDVARRRPVFLKDIEGLIDPAFEVEGCYLLPNDEAERRIAVDRPPYESEQNGRGPWAWNHHWLLVPLHDSAGEVIGVLWADEPSDRVLPSGDTLQALRVFANQAAAAVVASAHLNEVRFLADHDPLTRLLNRRAFVERLDGEVARATRYGHSFGLVLCDLDGFKELNDRFGHPAGDEALQVFARTLQSGLRKGDEAFRIGGDEFAVLLAEASEGDAREVVHRIVEQSGEIRASFGVASCPEHAGDSQSLFRLADAALYEAKRNGSGLQFVA
jgi:diguanylate cyclase (GGDEF)-like protein